MQILADENIHVDIIQGLLQRNYQILSVQDVDLVGRKDSEILEYCEEHDLILISGDKDFGGLYRIWDIMGMREGNTTSLSPYQH